MATKAGLMKFVPPNLRKLMTPTNMLIGGVGIVVVYMLMMRKNKKGGGGGRDIDDHVSSHGLHKGGRYAKDVVIDIDPESPVPSNSYMMLKGYFVGANNEATTVPVGYYYIFRDTGLATGYQYVFGGTLGQNVSTFNINVPTTFFQDGSYEVVVSDEPIPDATLGTGDYANPSYQDETSFKDSSNVIKNAITGFDPAPMFPSPNRVMSAGGGGVLPQTPPRLNRQDLASIQ